MTAYTVIPAGWICWTLEDPPVILGAGDTPAAAAEHAAERQRAGLAPEPGPCRDPLARGSRRASGSDLPSGTRQRRRGDDDDRQATRR